MKHKNSRRDSGVSATWAAGLRTTVATVMLAALVLWSQAVMQGNAKALNTPKDTLKLLKSSSSSALLLPQLARYKRDTAAETSPDDLYYDENFEVIPVMQGDPPKTMGEQIAESFSNMWQSLADTVKHCVEAIRQLFASGDGEDNYQLTPEQEEQMRAAMEARAKAIEEQNEIWRRNTAENQL